ncbi:MAG: flagellar protein FlaG [Synergistaceae bacterium]|nr:flagellar protein FlaG [Synergistaceae bacterium]
MPEITEPILNGEQPRGETDSQEAGRSLSAENKGATVSVAAIGTAPFDKDRLKDALKAAERLTEYSHSRLKFEYQEDADVFQVSVVDGGDEVIRKIPPDSILRMIENLKKFRGTTLDTKA